MRRILKGKQVENQWIRRINQELMDPYQSPSITVVVKYQRIRCIVHSVRLSDHKATKKILQSEATSKK